MIAGGLAMGISKRELLDDYYIDELRGIFEEYGKAKYGGRDGGTPEKAPGGMRDGVVYDPLLGRGAF